MKEQYIRQVEKELNLSRIPKPNVEMLEKIGIELDVPAERTVMIGDTTHDVIMAHRYGCDAAAMTYGASTLQDLIASKPAVLCPDVRALAEYLGVSELVKDVDFTR